MQDRWLLARHEEGIDSAIRGPGGGTMQDAFLPVQYAGPKFVASAITGEQNKRNTEQKASCPSEQIAGVAQWPRIHQTNIEDLAR